LRSRRLPFPADPRWIEARFTSHCARCPRIIKPGESAYYFPNSKTIFCDSEDCGKNEARLVEAALFDERMCAA
jgi:hypothetical protein